MIYVLSKNRIDSMRWAASQDIPLLKIRHVQTKLSLPGVLNPKTTRIVQLPSYAKRLDKFAINQRLKNITRRARIQIELWTLDDEGKFAAPGQKDFQVVPEIPRDDLVKMAVEQGVEFDLGGELPPGETEVTNQTGKPEITITTGGNLDDFLAKVAKTQSEVAKLYDAETLTGGDEVAPASFEGAEAGGSGQVAKTSLPSTPTEKATEPVDFIKREAEITEVQDVVEQTRDDLQGVSDEMDKLVEGAPEQLEKMLKPEAKKTRVRRTNAQIAYDKALVDWESNGGSVEAVQEARKALKAGDDRLETDPTEPDDLDF